MRRYRCISSCTECANYVPAIRVCGLSAMRFPTVGGIPSSCPLPIGDPISEVQKTPERFIRIIAVDFDGCLCSGKWPEVSPIRMDLVEKLLQEQMNGSKIILWSCRYGEELDRAVEACNAHGLHLDVWYKSTQDHCNRVLG